VTYPINKVYEWLRDHKQAAKGSVGRKRKASDKLAEANQHKLKKIGVQERTAPIGEHILNKM